MDKTVIYDGDQTSGTEKIHYSRLNIRALKDMVARGDDGALEEYSRRRNGDPMATDATTQTPASPISSEAMASRMVALISGQVRPESSWDQMMLDEMTQIGTHGFINIATDLPNPIDDDEYAAALALTDGPMVKSLPGQIGRRGRTVTFDPKARDADVDGRVQDGTQFERPATPRAVTRTTVARRTRLNQPGVPKPSQSRAAERTGGALRRNMPSSTTGGAGGAVQKSKYIKDTVSSPRLPTPEETKQLTTMLKKSITLDDPAQAKTVNRIREMARFILPFGGTRGPADGPHPAAVKMVDEFKELAAKYGDLDTIENMEKALQKAFPDAKIGLFGRAWYEPNGIRGPRDRGRFGANDALANLAKFTGQSEDEVRPLLEDICRAFTLTMLAHRERHPEVAKRLNAIGLAHSGMTSHVQSGMAAYVAQSELDTTKNVLILNPYVVAAAIKDWEIPYFAAGTDVRTMINLVAADPVGGATLSQIVSDSDMETYVATITTHEWGHLLGQAKYAEIAEKAGLTGDDLRKVFFEGKAPPTPEALKAAGLSDDQIKVIQRVFFEFSDLKDEISEPVKNLAADPHLLAKRLKQAGKAGPDEAALAKMDDAAREALARDLIEIQFLTFPMFSLLDGVMSGNMDRNSNSNRKVRAVSNYASSEPEEAGAEMYLGQMMGLDVSKITKPDQDPYFHDRKNMR